MVMVVMPVLQVIGYQNSGKTTVMHHLLRAASEAGLRAGTIKHHGHGGTPEYANSSKDSSLHFQSGAAISTVEGDGAFVVESESGLADLEKLLTFYRTLPLHVILVEGYKKEHYSKVAVVRREEDITLLEASNIKAVISAVPDIHTKLPVFKFNDPESYKTWFLKWIKEA
ncbi:molybdopterin-guanine dinucleotide biosynthesis protein B [Jeotgalibacillus salarius]|uniref:Molybdopterin-guanine dinucleotide biosynthesis protein B n=1 Tax=Jeotgalibacillus salarius TaxID=546023 RepID=A0A4Y8LHB9_9BACL|nr:molybdopterin-guanine dinucleotide biosynthesis protein B [Jeotgalibacillus salarius]TFE02114.1 molybdopterin-guanine dinucleotide biosynthesis protein B [Jeotgalibacillus salarius]